MNTHARQVQRRFDGEAKNWNRLYTHGPVRSIYARNLLDRKHQALSLLQGVKGRVLELGCGAGNVIMDLFSAQTAWCLGADFSLDMLKQARQNAQSLPLSAADARYLPFRENTLDAILCLGVLEYIPDYDRVLEECRRTLKPGGRFILSIPNRKSPFIRIDDLGFGLKNTLTQSLPSGLRNWIKTRVLGKTDKPYFNHRKQRFDPDLFEKRLKESGFEVLEKRYHTFGFGLLNGADLNQKVTRYFETHIPANPSLETFGWTCILNAIKS